MRLKPVALAFVALASLALAGSTRPGGSSEHDRVAARTACFRHQLGDAYLNDPTSKGPWDADARAFLDRMAVRFAQADADTLYATDIDVTNATMARLADGLAKCDDPLVNYCRAVIYKDNGDVDANVALLRRYAPKLVAGPYPPARRYFAATRLAELSPNDAKLAKQRDELLAPMLLEPTADPVDRRWLYDVVIDDVWHDDGTGRGGKSADHETFIDALAAKDADPWLVAMLRGVNAINAAWESRGNGWANTVTPEGWAGFHKNIAAARQHLQTAYDLEPTYPEAAGRMITVCMAESGGVDDARTWFDRSTLAQFDHMYAWSAYTQVLQPRWGGSVDAMLALAKEAADTRRYDTQVPLYATTIVDAATRENGGGQGVWRRPAVWPMLADVFDGYVADPRSKLANGWMATRRAGFAWKCGQFDEAQKSLDWAADNVWPAALTEFDHTPESLRGVCHAMTGAHAKAVRSADAAEAAFNFIRARQVYDGLLKTMPPDDADRPYVLRRHAAAAVTADVVTGHVAAVPLAGPDDLLAFDGDRAGWSVQDDALTYTGTPDARSTLTHVATLPPRTRVKLQWQWNSPAADAAPVFGVTIQDATGTGPIAVRLFPHDHGLCVDLAEKGYLARGPAPDAPLDDKPDAWHTLTIEHNGDTVMVGHDGRTVIDGYKNDWLAYGKPALALTAQFPHVGGTVRVRNLTVQMIR